MLKRSIPLDRDDINGIYTNEKLDKGDRLNAMRTAALSLIENINEMKRGHSVVCTELREAGDEADENSEMIESLESKIYKLTAERDALKTKLAEAEHARDKIEVELEEWQHAHDTKEAERDALASQCRAAKDDQKRLMRRAVEAEYERAALIEERDTLKDTLESISALSIDPRHGSRLGQTLRDFYRDQFLVAREQAETAIKDDKPSDTKPIDSPQKTEG